MAERKNINQYQDIKDSTKRSFVTNASYGLAAIGASCVAIPFIDSMSPSKDVEALASIEVDISSVKKGQQKKVMWRGKPIFIKRRTSEEIKLAENADISNLKDPENDSNRVKNGKKEWLITIGICTHLGCVPIGGSEDQYDGGWFCPCHGSLYDSSGRIVKGPAPKNLAIPPYEFISDNIVKIG